MSHHVLIIGGGITGLTAAFRLNEAATQAGRPLRITVIEASPHFGGKMQTLREGAFVIETGPDSILARKEPGVRLIRDLGIESETVSSNPAAQKTFIVHDGKLHDLPLGTNLGIPASLRPFAASNTLVSRAGKVRALQDLVLPVPDLDEDQSLGGLLKARLGEEWVNMLCEPLLAGIYAGSADDLSVQSTFPQFVDMLRESGSLIRGAVMARRQAQKAAKTTARQDTGRSAFITLRHGLSTITERLFDCLQGVAELYTETSATRIERRSDGRYRVSYQRQGEAGYLEADAVLVATPAPVTAGLLEGLAISASALEEIPYVSTATVVFAYDKSSVRGQFEGHDAPIGSGFVVPRVEGRPITACTWTSSKWPHTAAPDKLLLRCYVGRSGQTDGLAQADEDIAAIVLGQLRDLVGLMARPQTVHVNRWDNAMPQYRVGHAQRVEKVEHELAIQTPGLCIAGAAYHGVGIPDCIDNAEQAAKSLWNHLLSRALQD